MKTTISPTGHYNHISTRLLRHIATKTRVNNNKKHGHHLNTPPGLLSPYSVLSTVHRGTAFERCSLALLSQHMSMALTRVGGKEDGGVDLQGWWWLPPPLSSSSDAEEARSLNTVASPARPRPRRIRVLAQCKAEKKSLGPNYVREMEGVMYRILSTTTAASGSLAGASNSFGAIPAQISANAETYSVDATNSGHPTEMALTATTAATVGMIISSSPFGKSALLRAMSSPVPLFLLQLPFSVSSQLISDAAVEPSPSSDFVAAFWNAALAKGVLRDEFEVRLEHAPSAGEDRIRLWWNGERLGNYVPSDSGLVSS